MLPRQNAQISPESRSRLAPGLQGITAPPTTRNGNEVARTRGFATWLFSHRKMVDLLGLCVVANLVNKTQDTHSPTHELGNYKRNKRFHGASKS